MLRIGDVVQFGGCSLEVVEPLRALAVSALRESSIDLVAAAVSEQHDSYASLQTDAGTVTIVFSDIEASTERAARPR